MFHHSWHTRTLSERFFQLMSQKKLPASHSQRHLQTRQFCQLFATFSWHLQIAKQVFWETGRWSQWIEWEGFDINICSMQKKSYLWPSVLPKNKPIKYNQKRVWRVKLFSREKFQVFYTQTLALQQNYKSHSSFLKCSQDQKAYA